MEPQMFVKWIHVLSSTVLFGTGLGAAFFMAMALRTRDPKVIAGVARIAIVTNLAFTLTAGVVQPLTGGILMAMMELTFAPWIMTALGLYVIIGACWVPVVMIQARIKALADRAVADGEGMPAETDRLYRAWSILAGAVFVALVAIFYLMLAQPALWSHAE
jgi:uncharacterized membrane protein